MLVPFTTAQARLIRRASRDRVDMLMVQAVSAQAVPIASELAAISRPIMKCRAIVDRSFIRVNPGDAVKVTWSGPDLSGVVFRVAAVDRGTLADGKIALDLIQDYFYVYRQLPPVPGGLQRREIDPGLNLGFGG